MFRDKPKHHLCLISNNLQNLFRQDQHFLSARFEVKGIQKDFNQPNKDSFYLRSQIYLCTNQVSHTQEFDQVLLISFLLISQIDIPQSLSSEVVLKHSLLTFQCQITIFYQC